MVHINSLFSGDVGKNIRRVCEIQFSTPFSE